MIDSNTDPASVLFRLEQLRQRYAKDLPGRIEEARRLWATAGIHGNVPEVLAEMHRFAHGLAGSGATFGFRRLSQAALQLDRFLKDLLDHSLPPTSIQCDQVGAMVEGIVLAREQDERGLLPVDPVPCGGRPAPMPEAGRLLYLVEDDVHLARQLAAELEGHGYEVEVFTELAPLPDAVARRRPTAMVVDIIFPEGDLAGTQVIRAINGTQAMPVPAIFISVRDDQEARLDAVRAGGSHYFVKPIDMPAFLRTVASLTNEPELDPYRVMVVEDDPALADLYRLFLEEAGMSVKTVCEPLKVQEEIADFVPELLLMDIYMPECSGLDLAAMLRQQRRFDDMPIIFLSIEADADKQLAAMNLGGDDFLTKPVDCWQLVSAVRPRAKRARALRVLREERESTTQALLESEAELNRAQAVAQIGSWNLDIQANEFCWSREVYRMFGVPHGAPLTYEAFLGFVHPEDRKNVDAAWTAALQGAPYDIEHRILVDGEVRWVRERVEQPPTMDGTPSPMQSRIGTVQDISEQKRVEAALIAAKEKAEQASRAKSDFLRHMSHELRTPLNAILGFAQILNDDLQLKPGSGEKESLDLIQKAGWHLLKLIEQLLDLSKIESGAVGLSMEWIRLQPVLVECVDIIQPLAEKCKIGLSLDWTICPTLAVYADRTRLRQALLNLLSNAVKYNVPLGWVKVQCTRTEAGHARIEIDDTGPGLSPEQQGQLFEKFNRLGREGSNIEGSGIGLALTHRLVSLMAGRIGVDSATDSGSTFWLEFEAKSIDPLPEREAMQLPAETTDFSDVKTVLYVDDNPDSLQLMAHILARYNGLALLTAHNGELAYDLATLKKPDLIILDINLPDISGIDLCRRLKSHPEIGRTPIIALSANAMPLDIEQALAAGFEHYLTKPLLVAEFSELIERFVMGD